MKRKYTDCTNKNSNLETAHYITYITSFIPTESKNPTSSCFSNFRKISGEVCKTQQRATFTSALQLVKCFKTLHY